jgi:hypothetical protein
MYQRNGLTYVGDAPSPYPETAMTRGGFRNRFTFSEKVAIKAAEASDPMLQVLADDQAQATFIDLADPDTAAGLDLLIYKGLLAPERKAQILALPVTEFEKPLY